jgi:hypothetical protein
VKKEMWAMLKYECAGVEVQDLRGFVNPFGITKEAKGEDVFGLSGVLIVAQPVLSNIPGSGWDAAVEGGQLIRL